MRRNRRGISLAVALLVLTVLVVTGVATSTVGVQALNLATAEKNSRGAFYTAEGGLAQTVQRVEDDSTLKGILATNEPLSASGGTYTASVSNNLSSRTPMLLPDGTVIPPLHALVTAEGAGDQGGQRKRVTVLVKCEREFFDYAVMSGGDITLQGQSEVNGNMRANGSITFGGTSHHDKPDVYKGGKMMSGSGIDIQSTLAVEDASQEVRARDNIDGSQKIHGTDAVYADDQTKYTTQMLNDGSLQPPTQGEAIPNPDPATLLASGAYVLHNETVMNGGSLNLNNQVHYFPNGISFEKGVKIEGPGTIVVGEGHDAVFKCPIGSNTTPGQLNILSLDGESGRGKGDGKGNIIFENGTFLKGLIYAHNDVTFRANWRVQGSVVTYYGDVTASANTVFELDRIAVKMPGFETWLIGASQYGGPVNLSPVSWQDGQ